MNAKTAPVTKTIEPDPRDGVLAEVIAEAKRNGNFEVTSVVDGHERGIFARGGPGALEAALKQVRASIVRKYHDDHRQ